MANLTNLVHSLLVKNPENRLGSKNDYHEVLSHPYFKGVDKRKLMLRDGPVIKKMKLKGG